MAFQTLDNFFQRSISEYQLSILPSHLPINIHLIFLHLAGLFVINQLFAGNQCNRLLSGSHYIDFSFLQYSFYVVIVLISCHVKLGTIHIYAQSIRRIHIKRTLRFCLHLKISLTSQFHIAVVFFENSRITQLTT